MSSEGNIKQYVDSLDSFKRYKNDTFCHGNVFVSLASFPAVGQVARLLGSATCGALERCTVTFSVINISPARLMN